MVYDEVPTWGHEIALYKALEATAGPDDKGRRRKGSQIWNNGLRAAEKSGQAVPQTKKHGDGQMVVDVTNFAEAMMFSPTCRGMFVNMLRENSTKVLKLYRKAGLNETNARTLLQKALMEFIEPLDAELGSQRNDVCACGLNAFPFDRTEVIGRRCLQCKFPTRVFRGVVEELARRSWTGCCLIACAMIARFVSCEILEGFMVTGKDYCRHYVISWRGMTVDPGTEVARRVHGKRFADAMVNSYFTLTRPLSGANLAVSPKEIQTERTLENYFRLWCKDPDAFWAYLTLPWQREWAPKW